MHYCLLYISSCWTRYSTTSRNIGESSKNGATGVSQTTDLVSITFNKPMNTAYKSVSTSNWPSSFLTNYWSADGRTLYLPRQDVQYPFIPNTKVMIMINLPGYESIRDTEGKFAQEYNLTFWVESINYQRIAPQPEKGFNWPYLLYVPETVRSSTVLLVEPNNSGPSDDFAFHERIAVSFLNMRSPFSYVLKAPLLVPVFHDMRIYIHRLWTGRHC